MIELERVHKTLKCEGGAADAVAPMSLHIEHGQIFGIISRSGSGASTPPALINWQAPPGRLLVGRQDIAGLAGAQARAARPSIGMVFQRFELHENRTLLAANVSLPLELAGFPAAQARGRATDCLKWVGLADRVHSYPRRLSSGQKQRVAIARALALNPNISAVRRADRGARSGGGRECLIHAPECESRLRRDYRDPYPFSGSGSTGVPCGGSHRAWAPGRADPVAY